MTHLTSEHFKANAKAALANQNLQRALAKLKHGFIGAREKALHRLPEYAAIRDAAAKMKDETLANLDFYLAEFTDRVVDNGGHVHFASDAQEANAAVLAIAKAANAKRIIKGKSMVSEEIGLNDALIAAGFSVFETDLGEYIIQLRKETPSHIVVPAIHVLKEQIAADFTKAHTKLPADRVLDDAQSLLVEARTVLRDEFLQADIGITGANFLIAENGASVIVTNEGNGDLVQTCPKIHIVLASIEKIYATVDDALTILRLLARSATGQEITSYVTFSIGPKRPEDLDGPSAYHVILVDNGRSKMLGDHFRPMLRCIRCAACLNHCPVYGAIGGHAYGSPYPGPMGAVLSPSLFGLARTKDLPNASTFCGRCDQVCPMSIPLTTMMRYYRESEFDRHLSSFTARTGLKTWAFFAKRPWLYHLFTAITISMLYFFGRKKGRFHYLPLASGWTAYRDFPAPTGKTFQQLWRKHGQS